tara:strand:+ start:371 stop:1051 length:681 start_codon:yes stop_codon:yes gene_type:complete
MSVASIIQRACFILPVFIFSLLHTPSLAAVVIPESDVVEYCVKSGCDSQVFYRYYNDNSERFCKERSYLVGESRQAKVMQSVMHIAVIKGMQPTAAVIPLLESSLNPSAVASSHANAAKGMWQMKPDTARDMGLRVDASVDERLDINLSTTAGLKYLSWLERKFDGDHNLAVLAYHTGIGNVERMISKYGTDNAWFLSRLLGKNNADKDYLLKYYSYSLALMKKGC